LQEFQGGILRVCYLGEVVLPRLRAFCQERGIPLIERKAGQP